MAYSVEKYGLPDLSPDITNAIVVAIIIGKQQPREFTMSQGAFAGQTRGVWSFTIRDLSRMATNVTCWGRKEFVDMLNDSFRIGDVVDITKPRVQFTNVSGRSESYMPSTNSPITLVVTEGITTISVHDGNDYNEFLPLLHIPTKNPAGFLSLAEIDNNRANFAKKSVDILVAVRMVGQHRVIKKNDRELNICNVVVMDRSHPGAVLTIWDKELIERAQNWKSRDTILFCASIQVTERDNLLSVNGRTIITVDPQCDEVFELRQYVRGLSLHQQRAFGAKALVDDEPSVDVNAIKNAISVATLGDKIKLLAQNDPEKLHNQFDAYRFTALLYCHVTEFDITDWTKIVRVICPICTKPISQQLQCCFNAECPVGSGAESVEPVTVFHIRTSLTDHSGHARATFSAKVCEEMFGCSADQVKTLSEATLMEIKWTYLFERNEVKIMLAKKRGGRVDVTILSCKPADPTEAAQNLPWH